MLDIASPGKPGGEPARCHASASRRRRLVAAFCTASAAFTAQAGDWTGTAAVSSQLVDRGVAVTPPGAVAQGAVSWVSRDGWSLGVSASYQTHSPGRVAETLAQVARAWSLTDDWQMQASLLHYRYPGNNAGARTYDRTELGVSWIWRDVLTLGASAIQLAHRGGGPRGAADVGFRWPLLPHLSATAGAGIAQYLAPLYRYYGQGSRPDRYRYGHAGLVWQDGPWRLELIHVFTDRQLSRGERGISPWVGTVAWSF
ncbi:hypothetical protein KPL74_14245 [Bacillus sp. NP157]|nr:hypothetical protein KPL74_14245 [Bacillus sp. NP157]